MKTLIVIMTTLLLSGFAKAQDCGYYSMSKGTTYSYQNFDGKGKLTGTARNTCLAVNKIGAATIYKIKGEFADAKNSNQSSTEYEMRCENGQFYMDMKNFIDPKSMEGFKNMEVTVDSKDMVYPASLSAGQSLPDASIKISAATGGVALMNLVVTVANRKVAGTESVTVPAGTFECYKITYDVETKMMFKINTSVIEYVNKGVGNVKTESFDKKGKMLSSSVLSEVSK